MSTEKQDNILSQQNDTENTEQPENTTDKLEDRDTTEDSISQVNVDVDHETVSTENSPRGDQKTAHEDRAQKDSDFLEQILKDQVVQRFNKDVLSIESLESYTREESRELGSQFEELDEEAGDVFVSRKCTLNSSYLDIEYSFGYDCEKNFNICCPDPNYLVFLSGCFIHILDLSTKVVELRRASGGQGLGCITKNHIEPHIAIGEKGQSPDIFIYEWPSFDVVSVLRGGSVKQYTCLDYSPAGDILVSQSGEPDHMIAIWNWKQRHVILKVKSHAQDVFNVSFSKYVTGHLSSSGLGHIKMWKMVNTFTSLKLLGIMGRFGKTTTCDILAIYPMPDEKVLSGSEWGNILIWDDGLIKIEVSRKNRRSCHENQIVQFLYDPKALQITTVGSDGFIRVWNYQTIDLANPPEDEKFVELEPIFEIEVKQGIFEAHLMHIVECPGTEDNTWFGQDKMGGFWRLHVEVTNSLRPAEKLYVTHAGSVIDMSASPRGLYLASVGIKGRLAIWSIEDKKLVLFHDSKPGQIVCIEWLSTEALPSGCAIVVGLASGLVKVLIVRLKEKLTDPAGNKSFDQTNEAKWLHPVQVLKPHTARVTCLVSNPEATHLISGSEDKTIFIFAIRQVLNKNLVQLEPIGLVDTMGGVSHLYWNTEQRNSILVSCTNGYSMQIQIPPNLPSRSGLSSYKISKLNTKVARFRSVKARLTRAAYMNKVHMLKDAKLKRKKQEAEEMKKKNPAMEFDEFYFYDSEEELYLKDLPEEYIPPEPNPILFTIPMVSPLTSQPTTHSPDAVWVSVDGYDAGLLYGMTMSTSEVGQDEEEGEGGQDVIHLPNITDVAATCAIKDINKNHLYVGFGDGTIRLIEIDPHDIKNMSRYIQLATHDRQYGRINKLCTSTDQTRLYSCGNDGNIFSYLIRDASRDVVATPLEFSNVKMEDLDIDLPEIENSLEEEKQKIRQGDRIIHVKEKKQGLLSTLNILQQQLTLTLKRLNDIPESLKPPEEEFELDPRITEATDKMAKEPLELIKTKMRYNIEKSNYGYEKLYNYFMRNVDCFYKYIFDTRCERYVTTFTLSKMKSNFDIEMENILSEMGPNNHVSFNMLDDIKEARIQSKEETKEISETNQKKPSFLKDLESFKHKLPLRTQRALRKYYESREEIVSQKPSLEEFEKSKSDLETSLDCNSSDDNAPTTVIGNYTMKSDPEYRVPKNNRTSHKTKTLQILKTEKEIYNLKKNFNDKVKALLQEKMDLIMKMKQWKHDMKQRQTFIPVKFHQTFPSIPCLNYDLEFPEKKFQNDQLNPLDEFEPKNMWKSEELDLLKPPPTGTPLSDAYSNVHPDSIPEIISHLVGTKIDEASQTVFKLDTDKPLEPPLVLPSPPTSQPPRDVLSYPMLPDNDEADVYGSNMFLSTLSTSDSQLQLQSSVTTQKSTELDTIPCDMSVTEMEQMFKLDQQESPLEKELRKDTILRLILEQASILYEVERSKEKFDQKVKHLSLERFTVAESVKLLELFLLTLHEEAIVLDKFKDGENAIQVEIDEESGNIQKKLAKIAEMEKHIRTNDERILQLKGKVKSVEASFAAFNRNSPKYALMYYKKVFQKKLKIRKLKLVKAATSKKSNDVGGQSSYKKYSEDREDRSDYTTSSEEEEDDLNEVEAEDKDNGGGGDNEDEEDMWNENQPPPGLNPKTLETVVQLRLRRHEVEEEIADINYKTDALLKEISLVANSIKYLKSVMDERNEELDKIITEKQKNLNKVETTVVLKVSQLKNEDSRLTECIVLPSSQLAWLNNRSYELKKQTDIQRKQFQEYDKTLSKMKSENVRLQEQYKNLLGQVNEATIKKYGKLVNVAELEEAVLQALVHEVRMDVPQIVKSLDADLKQKQLKLEEEKTDLLKMIKNQTDSLRFLVTLKEEKSELEKEINIINSKKQLEVEKHKHSQSNYDQDIAKLSTIYDTMQHEELLIMKELCDLTYKGTRPPSKLPPIKKEINVKSRPKNVTTDRQTALKNATGKIKEILESLNVHSPDTHSYNHLVDDLQELYGLNIKDETVDDVVDVLVDLTTKQEESNMGVSNAEVMKATLSMLLLDIEQTESQLEKKHEGDDDMSVHSNGSVLGDDNTDIIKVSVQPDEGVGKDWKDRVNETEEFSENDIVKSETGSEGDGESKRGELEEGADGDENSGSLDDKDVENRGLGD